MTISVFDTTIAGDNLGNNIIMDSVNNIIDELFPNDFILYHSAFDFIGTRSITGIQRSMHTFFGGSNMLSAQMDVYTQWSIAHAREKVSDVILCGVGWWQYQEDVNQYTHDLLHDVLHHDIVHSVRDAYTQKKLQSVGFKNVVNTLCPTMWGLTADHCAQIPKEKAENVVVTFTNYNINIEYDYLMLNILKKKYKDVYLWVQGPEDEPYAQAILPEVKIVPPRVEAFNNLLNSDLDIEYIGTRLHAGLRALQCKRRATILAVDNRATEIARDSGLNVIPRENLEELYKKIHENARVKLNIPWKAIEFWKNQFK